MRERIISEIRRIAGESGKAPGIRAFELATGILRREWTGKIWARWSDAVREAGFEPNALTERMSSDVIVEQVAFCCLSLGRVPASNDLRLFARQNSGFPSQTTIENHFPRRAMLIEALREVALRNPKYGVIGEMLPVPEKGDDKLSEVRNGGHVYLIKAGNFYKIGRSDQLERRVREIRIALPQAATLEHTIATDDPPGIETYWHRRFADRRANGEWFQLTKADVLAFKKRKFQ